LAFRAQIPAFPGEFFRFQQKPTRGKPLARLENGGFVRENWPAARVLSANPSGQGKPAAAANPARSRAPEICLDTLSWVSRRLDGPS
jgi:hypothetical protein